MRVTGLEPPFVGRDRQLRLIKETLHATGEEGRAHMVSVVGAAGMGKSRLVWEFNKYIDGLVEDTRWHVGRCLAYGEGITFWALAEMVRTNATILEGEAPVTALPTTSIDRRERERRAHRAPRGVTETRWTDCKKAHACSAGWKSALGAPPLTEARTAILTARAQVEHRLVQIRYGLSRSS